MPNYAFGQQVRKDDERIRVSYETVPSPNGHGYIKGYFARPDSLYSRDQNPGKLPGVIIVHENRGLNPHTEDVARRFALENFIAFAPDALSSVGGYPGDDYKGGLLFGKLDGAKRTSGLPGGRAVVEGSSAVHGQDRRDRLLLRRRHGEHALRHDGPGSGGGCPVLRRRAQAGRCAEDQGGDPHPPRRPR
jgi:hypothetical protein